MTSIGNTTKRNTVRTLSAVACLVSTLGVTPSFAACTFPNSGAPTSLTQLRAQLLPGANHVSSLEIDNEGFSAPAAQVSFTAIDAVTGNFTGRIAFDPIRTYPISGRLGLNGGSNFSITFTYRPVTTVTTQYVGAIRAFRDQDCFLRYHIAGVINTTRISPIIAPTGPSPFSGKGFSADFG